MAAGCDLKLPAGFDVLYPQLGCDAALVVVLDYVVAYVDGAAAPDMVEVVGLPESDGGHRCKRPLALYQLHFQVFAACAYQPRRAVVADVQSNGIAGMFSFVT